MSAYRYHQRQVEDLYFDDPSVTQAQYAAFMEEAEELDRQEEANAEALSYWESLAEAEAEEEA